MDARLAIDVLHGVFCLRNLPLTSLMRWLAFGRGSANPVTLSSVDHDRRPARGPRVRTVPALILPQTGFRLDNGPLDALRDTVRASTFQFAHA